MDKKLVDMYYDLISWDYHKSRDLCFLVEVSYEDGKLTYFASHPGYLKEFASDVDSMEEGWEFLNTNLKEAVKEQLDWVREVQAMTPEERELRWLLDVSISEDYLKEIEEYIS